ncbi:uncharacterized protein LOC112495091 isoform X2 [Cephus cinctus]|uniref:Uncharacterized protein LOC112495091 isoform X2 n=1 Tax=Cephus cinctus TaxID=211228 RepID=A0AAJ7W5U8_CEPCN|nr:uncharacterized protein LOC112495091 isoform X2 [Cephus cinctus]XP_024945709.1 uncharacterized protein LOC112495091 isoform X2 [Cephus cinctus]
MTAAATAVIYGTSIAARISSNDILPSNCDSFRSSRYLNCRTYIPAEASEWLGLASQIGDAEWTERVYQEAYKASPTPN